MKQYITKLIVLSIFFLSVLTTNAQLIFGPTNVSEGSVETYLVFAAPSVPCGDPIAWAINPSSAGTILSQSGIHVTIQWHCAYSGASIDADRPKCIVSWGHDKPKVDQTLSGINIIGSNPVAGPINGTDTVCEGTSTSYSISSVSGASSYEWNITNFSNACDSADTSGTSIEIYWKNISTSQDVDLTVTPYSGPGCAGTTSPTFEVHVQAFSTVSLSGITSVCGGDQNETYSVTPSVSGDILYYDWDLPIGVNIVSGDSTASITVDFDPYAQSGDFVATAMYTCGPGLSDEDSVYVKVLPYPPSQIQGALAVCNPTTTTYSIDAIANADSYTWSATGGTLDSTSTINPEVSIEWNVADTGTITVTPVNSCGSSPTSSSLDVIVHPSTSITPVDTVIFDDDSLSASVTQYLEFNHCESSNSCTNKIIDEATLFITYNTGDIYNYGTNSFSTSVDVYYIGYGGLSHTGPVIISDTITLEIDEANPEQTFNLDITNNYYQIQSFAIEVASYSSSVVVDDDIQLVAYVNEKFKYNALSSSPLVSNLVNTNLQPTRNQYRFSWSNDCEAFSNYEIQLLRLFNNDTNNTTSQSTISANVDWGEALSVETQSSDTSIVLTLAEGTGYYVWRVRPIGNYFEGGIANDKNHGLWSDHTGYEQGATGVSGTSAPAFFYNQFNDTINWIYGRTFTEGNLDEDVQVRIAENMTFANGLQQVQQTQAHLSTNDKILTTQTINDFSGRPAFTSIPVPLNDEVSLGYKYEFMKNSGDSLYTAEDFDDDANYNNPEPVKDASGEHFEYYSDNNSDTTIANAEQYPFSRTLFYNDGNSRVKEQSGPTDIFRIKSNLTESRTNKTFYSGVADDELVRVFGDEAPYRESVHKVINVDANNTATVTYMAKDGKTLATCLAINGSNTIGDDTAPLMGLESQNLAILTVNDTINNTIPYGDYGNQATTSQTFVEQTTVNIYYDLTPKAVEDICLDYCATCDYYFEISVQDIEQPDSAYMYYSELLPSEICDSADFSAYEMDTTITLPPGTFIFTKRVVANNTDPNTITTNDSIGYTYLQQHLDSIRNGYDSLIYGSSGQLDTINGYLDSADVTGMYEYLGVDLDVYKPDSVYQDSVVFITIGCDSLPIPIILCPQKLCPPEASFADYFDDFWGGTYSFDTTMSGGYTKENFDTLVSNMVSDGYKCDSLWDCWYGIVQSYEILNDSLYGNPNMPAGTTFNIVDAFLDCAGRRIEGISTTKFGSPGYLSHAYSHFNYAGGDTLCEAYFVEQYGYTYPSGDCGYPSFCFADSTWTEFYHCVTSQDPNPSNPVAQTDPDSAAQMMTDTCELYCEAKKAGFIDAIIYAFHQDSQYVEANPDTSALSVYQFSGDIYELEYDTILNSYQFNDTLDLDEGSTTFVEWDEIECMADALVRNCKEGCTLTPVFDTITGDTLLSMGTEEEQLAFEQSFTWAYEVSLFDATNGCGAGWDTVDTGTSPPYGITKVIDTLVTTSDTLCATDSSTTPCTPQYYFIEDFYLISTTVVDNQVDFMETCIYTDSVIITFTQDGSFKYDSVVTTVSDTICETIYPCGEDLCFRYVSFPEIPDSIPEVLPITCEESATIDILNSVEQVVYEYIEDKIEAFEENYMNTCVNPDSIDDNFYLNYPLGYHHYTLYYYDRAGNLIQTVPPQGVDLLDTNMTNDPIDEYTMNRSTSPKHRFITDYEYNSLGQLILQQTPDGDTTRFYYNNLGQLRFSQNAQQKEDTAYSYTKYDELGRIIEVGESEQAAANQDFTLAANVANDDFPNDTTYNSEVTYTVYTDDGGVSYLNDAVTTQRYLLNRVSYTYTDDDANLTTTSDQTYTYYSYDPHGNVEWMVQDIPGFLGKQYLRYEYDLVSGNVLKVCYNEGKTDQFYHRYSYDADNRITSAETSLDNIIWENDASYSYYAHGPLSRSEIGEDKIQGMDYVYTIQGWLKALNHPSLDSVIDPGNDGITGSSDFAKDVFAMQLGYFTGDFNRTGSAYNTNTSGTVHDATLNPDANRDLYNGNISTWASNNLQHPSSSDSYPGLTGTQYRYDELNRIRVADFKENINVTGAYSAALEDYSSNYRYDANGNLYNLNRIGNTSGGIDMDSLKYYYYDASGNIYDETSTVPTLPTNKLAYVNDYISSGNYNTDIDAQYTNNYEYDKIGNLIKDSTESIAEITWTVYGKIKTITRVDTSSKPDLEFIYDASGNRVAKIVKPDLSDPSQNVVTWYVRDASGNIMSVYKSTYDSTASGLTEEIDLIEQPIYASSRVGQRTENKLIKTIEYPTSGSPYETINIANTKVTENTNMAIGVQKPFTLSFQWSQQGFPHILISPKSGAKQEVNFATPASPQVNSPNAQFAFGEQGNNICVVEDDNGNYIFSAYTARQYLLNTNVCRVLDANNNLMPTPGLGAIKSDWRGKSLGIRKPGTTNEYYLITVGTDNKPYYHEINTTTGQVTSINNLIDPSGTGYGYGMAVIEDQSAITSSKLYLRKYSGGNAYLVSVPITTAGFGIPDTVASFSSQDATGKGEIQISPDGTKLAIANQKSSYAWLSNAGEIRVYNLDPNHDVTGLNTTFSTSGTNNFTNLQSIDFSPTGEHVYYNQQTTVLIYPPISGNSVNIKKVNLATLHDTIVIANTYGDVRRGKDGNMYVATKGQMPLQQIGDPDNNFSVSNFTFATSPWQTTQGIPLQPHKILEIDNNLITRTLDYKNYEINDHLGNVRAVVSDIKESTLNGGVPEDFEPDIVAINNYYPFGSVMPGRNSNSGDYRYGFQGQEGDSEIKGVGNSWNYKYRMHDPRLGRFFAVDPLAPDYPWNSPYAFSENRVISAVELEGLEADDLNTTTNTATNSTNTPTDQRNPDIPSLPAPISFNQAQNDPQLLFNTILQTKEVALSTGTPVNLNQVVTGLPNTPTSISGNVNLRDPLPGHNKPLQAQTTFNISSNSIISAGIGDVTATPSAFITLPSFSVGGGGQGAGNQQQGVGVMTSFNLQFQGGGNVNFTFNQNVNSPNVVLNNVAGGVGFFEKIYNTSLNLRDNAVSWGNTSIPPTGGNRLNLTNQLQNQMQQLNNQVNQVRQSMGLPPARIGF